MAGPKCIFYSHQKEGPCCRRRSTHSAERGLGSSLPLSFSPSIRQGSFHPSIISRYFSLPPLALPLRSSPLTCGSCAS